MIALDMLCVLQERAPLFIIDSEEEKLNVGGWEVHLLK
jgi:hypothetical protein